MLTRCEVYQNQSLQFELQQYDFVHNWGTGCPVKSAGCDDGSEDNGDGSRRRTLLREGPPWGRGGKVS